jgi:uncharacterized protein YdhG (YjbR/CyaY superfamily)
MTEAPTTIDDYIAGYPEDVQAILVKVRAAVHAGVPGGEERIRYGIPAVMLGGRYAVHFAAWKKHLGMYPVPTLDPALEAEIAPYRVAKDSVNFPYKNPIPYELIERVSAAIYAKRGAAD